MNHARPPGHLPHLPQAAVAAALLAAALWSAGEAAANFGGSEGFSGVAGPTCSSCHQPPHPAAPPASAHLEGLPAAWRPGASYPLRVRVAGGPDPLPPPAPQGGFDLATDLGRLQGDPLRAGQFRQPSPQEVTYTAAGTQARAWDLVWTAPGVADLAQPPAPARFWLAVVAANGNHVVALGAHDGGETLDATASLQASVPPDPAAVAAWRALPLAAPEARAAPADGGGWTVEGAHRDGNATALTFRLDGGRGGRWETRPTGPAWRLLAPAGARLLEFRSEGAGRASPVVPLALGDGAAPAGSADPAAPAGPATAATPRPSPAPLAPLLAVLAVATHLRRPRPT